MAAAARIDVQPAEGLLSDPFTITIAFVLPDLLQQASWQVGFLVDMANLKHLVPLGATPSQPLQSGDNTLHFEAPGIHVMGLQSYEVLNLGMLTAVLQNLPPGPEPQQQEVLTVNIMTKVYQQDGKVMCSFDLPSQGKAEAESPCEQP